MVKIDATSRNQQLEFANFWSDLTLKEKCCSSSLTDFCSKYVYSTKYPEIRTEALLMLSLFGGTHYSEQLFSVMKNVKSRTRMHLTDEYLEGCMRITIAEIV